MANTVIPYYCPYWSTVIIKYDADKDKKMSPKEFKKFMDTEAGFRPYRGTYTEWDIIKGMYYQDSNKDCRWSKAEFNAACRRLFRPVNDPPGDDTKWFNNNKAEIMAVCYPPEPEKSDDGGAIAGAIIGVLIFLALIIFIVWLKRQTDMGNV